jgi:opacity protein-like surface antigen
MKKSFEDILNEKTQGFQQVKMRENMWENIESQLPPEEKKKKGLFFWSKPFLVAATLLLLLGLGILINQYSNTKTESKLNAHKEVSKQLPDASSSINGNETNETLEDTKIENNSISTEVVQSKNLNRQHQIQPMKPKAVRKNEFVSNNSSNEIVNTMELDESIVRNSKLIFAKQLNTPTIQTELDTNLDLYSGKSKKKRAIVINFFTEASYMPTQSSSIVDIDDQYRSREPYRTTFEKRQNGDMGLQSKNFSLSVGAKVNHFRVSIGYKQNNIRYSMLVNNVKSGINSAGVYNRFDYFATDTFAVESAETGAGSYSSEYQFTSIPFRVGYQFNINRKFSMLVQPEISYNKLKKHNGLVSTTESGIYVKPDIAQANLITEQHLAYGASLFLEYNVVKNLYLGAGVNYNRAINPIENGVVSTRYQQAGLQFSLRYQFNWKKYMYF